MNNGEDSTVKLFQGLKVDFSPWTHPQQSLNLPGSDAEVVGESSILIQHNPLLKYNAPGQKDLPMCAEMQAVDIKDCPARVVCRMCDELEHFLIGDVSALRDLTYSSGDGPNRKTKESVGRNVSGFQLFTESSIYVCKDCFNSNKEATSKSVLECSGYGSSQNRENSKNILIQEIVKRNLETASLLSETAEMFPQFLEPCGKNIINEVPLTLPSHGEYPTRVNSVLSRSSQTENAKCEISFSQRRIEYDSDSFSDCVPIVEIVSSEQTTRCEAKLCPLNEYVPSEKPQENHADHSVQNEETADAIQSIKKKVKTSRSVASRYLQSSVKKASVISSKTPNTQPCLPRRQLKFHPLAQTSRRQLREKLHVTDPSSGEASKKPAHGTISRNANVSLPVKSSYCRSQPSIVVQPHQSLTKSDSLPETMRSSEYRSKKSKASSPTKDHLYNSFEYIDALAIQSASTMSMSSAGVPSLWPSTSGLGNGSSNDKRHAPEKLSGRRYDTPHISCATRDKANGKSQLKFDMEYSRYLQMAFLSCKARKAYDEQETAAQAQIHGLWKLLESEREKREHLKMDVSRLDVLIKHNNLLHTMEGDLDTASSILPELEATYSRLSSELDATRHHLPIKDIYFPAAGRSEEKKVYKDQLKSALSKSEQLLVELDELTGTEVQPLSQYLDGIEDIDNSASVLSRALQDSQYVIDALKGLTTQLTSLYVQDM